MKLAPTSRLRRLALGSLLLGVVAEGCYESPAGVGPKLRLLEPLNMAWRGKESGDAYHGGSATFSAATSLRANWTLQIESDRGAVYKQEDLNQDRIEFRWDGSADAESAYPFDYGDHCVARVTFEVLELDSRDAAKAEFTFDIR